MAATSFSLRETPPEPSSQVCGRVGAGGGPVSRHHRCACPLPREVPVHWWPGCCCLPLQAVPCPLQPLAVLAATCVPAPPHPPPTHLSAHHQLPSPPHTPVHGPSLPAPLPTPLHPSPPFALPVSGRPTLIAPPVRPPLTLPSLYEARAPSGPACLPSLPIARPPACLPVSPDPPLPPTAFSSRAQASSRTTSTTTCRTSLRSSLRAWWGGGTFTTNTR